LELVTIAKPYVQALFDIADKDGSHQTWLSVLKASKQLADDAQMREFIASPKVEKTRKTELMSSLLQSSLGRSLSAQESIFIKLLFDNARINALPSMLALFAKKINALDNAKVFNIFSAYPLSDSEQQQLTDILSKKYNSAISINTTVEPTLVGGLVIKDGDKVVDLSIQARTEGLSSRLLATH
jgi:F-type H+-transporting ATPase subunit delta